MEDLLARQDIVTILKEYGIEFPQMEYSMIDSSHDEDDIRQNYIINQKYVLRLNSAEVMSEERLADLNRLIRRYNDFGIRAPYFHMKPNGEFLTEFHGMTVYLSDYLDAMIAYDYFSDYWEKEVELWDGGIKRFDDECIAMVARFAEKYKDVDLSAVRSEYSIFELSPYSLEAGIDEKQDNMNMLVQAVREYGEDDLADRLVAENERVRFELKKIYKKLPCCFVHGDESYGNLCVEEGGHIIGLFDFNTAGTEVCANYLANTASLRDGFFYDDTWMEDEFHGSKWILGNICSSFDRATKIIRKNYQFTELELKAYYLYSKIVLLSGYKNITGYMIYLEKEKSRSQALSLLNDIVNVQFGVEISD